jgi:hypothetical protein
MEIRKINKLFSKKIGKLKNNKSNSLILIMILMKNKNQKVTKSKYKKMLQKLLKMNNKINSLISS